MTRLRGCCEDNFQTGWCQEASLRKTHLIQDQNESLMQIPKELNVFQATGRARAKAKEAKNILSLFQDQRLLKKHS